SSTSAASRARCFGPPSGSSRSASITSIGPRRANRMRLVNQLRGDCEVPPTCRCEPRPVHDQEAPIMFRLVLLAAPATLPGTGAVASARSDPQRLAVTSSLDGKRVLPQMIRWIAHPNVAPANVAEVDYLIDGKLRWIELKAPYNYASDDYKGHLGYLFTSWLAP